MAKAPAAQASGTTPVRRRCKILPKRNASVSNFRAFICRRIYVLPRGWQAQMHRCAVDLDIWKIAGNHSARHAINCLMANERYAKPYCHVTP
jgi:hypothetical protein